MFKNTSVLALRIKGGNTMNKIKRGEIYYIDLGLGKGSEVGKTRPCIVLQNNIKE